MQILGLLLVGLHSVPPWSPRLLLFAGRAARVVGGPMRESGQARQWPQSLWCGIGAADDKLPV